jgi:hypothetical protein
MDIIESGAPPLNECPFRRDPERTHIFRENGGFWWNNELQCWMASDPRLIVKILEDNNFSVHAYNFAEIAERLHISFPHQKLLRAYLPVAIDGEDHKVLRRRFNEEISRNTSRALAVFDEHFISRISTLLETKTSSRFCVVQDLLKAPIRSGNTAIAGIESCDVKDLENLSLFFDGNLSVKRRQYIEQLIEALVKQLPTTMSTNEKYFRIALLTFNMSSLLGSISESFAVVVKRNGGAKLKDMDWDLELPATGLPMIERRAIASRTISGKKIKAGDLVQLFVDVDVYDQKRGSRYSDLYFAAGPHKCPGMNYSRRVWNILARHMKTIEKRLSIRSIAYRHNDRIFNFIDRFEVEQYV